MAEGQTIPGDCQLICDYNNPQDVEEFKKLKDQDKFDAETEADPSDKEKGGKAAEDDIDDDQSVHYGHSLIACGEWKST